MSIYTKGIYFLADGTSFSYTAHCLADGLSQIGIPVFSDIDYSNDRVSSFVFCKRDDPELFRSSFYAVYDIQDVCNRFKFMSVNFSSEHPQAAALCMEDEISNFCISNDIPFFCTHENRFRSLKGNRIPICFGVSQKMIDDSLHLPSFNQRKQNILKSFRPSERQDVRAMMELIFLPQVKKHWSIDSTLVGEGRWDSVFFDFLKDYQISLAYGGAFNQDLSSNSYFSNIPSYQLFRSLLDYSNETVILRWDNWRLWETLAAGCVAIHLDFDLYGFKLPVMPENWKHYIGLDLSNLKKDMERMFDQKDLLEEIAYNGRKWAIEHYSPVAVAKRFISTMKVLYPGNAA